MAAIIGKDTYLEEQKLNHSLIGILLIYLLFILDISYVIFIWKFHTPQPISNIVGLILIIIFIILRKPINYEIRKRWNYIFGLRGEQYVQKILRDLPESYKIVANVVLPGKQSNIDIVVVGPNGVFAIEVKSHKGRISYDGQQLLRYGRRFEKDFLWQAKDEARGLYIFLGHSKINVPFVEPTLVFSSRFASVRFGKKSIEGVIVIGAKWLNETILNKINNVQLNPEQISNIVSVLENITK